MDAIAKGMYHESMKERIDKLESERSTLKLRIQEANFELEHYQVSKDEIKQYVQSFQDIRTADQDTQKKAIHVFVDHVIVYDDHFDIEVIDPIYGV